MIAVLFEDQLLLFDATVVYCGHARWHYTFMFLDSVVLLFLGFMSCLFFFFFLTKHTSIWHFSYDLLFLLIMAAYLFPPQPVPQSIQSILWAA